MSTLTPNYSFVKPADSEFALVDILNTNTQSIDTILKARVDEAAVLREKELGLEQVLYDTNSKVTSAGAWATLFELSAAANTTPTTHWILDLRFAGRKTTGTLPTSLSLRVDRGANYGGTLILLGGANTSHIMTSQEAAVAGAVTTFTGLHPPDEAGQAEYWYDFRIACAGEASNSDKLKIEVSPVGANASFSEVCGKLTLRS